MNIFNTLLDNIPIPRMVEVEQTYERPKIEDLEASLRTRLEESGLLEAVKKGMRIAITAGSRGIAAQPLVLKIIAAECKRLGAKPFIIPAMGSHGGATPEGQRSMLEGMGITEESVGAPIRSTMEVVRVGTSKNGLPAVIDKYAAEADGIILFNRIKPHTAFRGSFESGLMKMIAIGLGKQRGAELCHELGFGCMAENIPAIGKTVIAAANIIFAVGLVENAYHEPCRLEVLAAGDIEKKEPLLLEEAKRLAPKLYFNDLDVLIIDEIGKNISGTGFDTNTVGRYHTSCASGGPRISKITVLDITDVSHGNANGIGIADFTTQRAYRKMCFDQTYPNALSTTVPASVKIPMVLKNDRHAIQAAVRTCNILDKSKVRMARIKNTMEMDTISVSESVLEEVDGHNMMERAGDLYELSFDAAGNLF